jgi:hypothetical protein
MRASHGCSVGRHGGVMLGARPPRLAALLRREAAPLQVARELGHLQLSGPGCVRAAPSSQGVVPAC